MVVWRFCIELCKLFALRGNLGVACLVRKGHQSIGVRDIQSIADQHHAKWRVQPRQERCFQLRFAISIGVTQQCDAVGRRHARASLAHQPFHDEAFNTANVARRGICFSDQNITIGQDIHVARMVETFCKALDNQTRRSDWRFAGFPAVNLGNLNRRENLFAALGDVGLRPGHRIQRQLRDVRTGNVPDASKRQRDEYQRNVANMLPHFSDPYVLRLRSNNHIATAIMLPIAIPITNPAEG